MASPMAVWHRRGPVYSGALPQGQRRPGREHLPLDHPRRPRPHPGRMAPSPGRTIMAPSDPGGPPAAGGLYDPAFEHDACGVGLVADLRGRPSHRLVSQALSVLERLAHRGASGAEVATGDGAGILMQVPDRFLREVAAEEGIDLPGPGRYV